MYMCVCVLCKRFFFFKLINAYEYCTHFLLQLLYYLNAVNFTTPVGELVYFEDNGEPSASYDIMNWHVDKSGEVNFIQVGQFDAAKGPGQELNISLEKVFWGGGWTDKVRIQCLFIHYII